MVDNMKKSILLNSLGLYSLLQRILDGKFITEDRELPPQFVPLSEQDQLRRLDGIHIFSKLRHFSLEKLLLTFQLFFRVLQLGYQPYRFPSLFREETLHFMEPIDLFLGQLHFLIKISSPLPRRIRSQCPRRHFLIKDIPLMHCRMHEVAMHGRKQRIDNLLKVIFQLSLPLLAIRTDSILP